MSVMRLEPLGAEGLPGGNGHWEQLHGTAGNAVVQVGSPGVLHKGNLGIPLAGITPFPVGRSHAYNSVARGLDARAGKELALYDAAAGDPGFDALHRVVIRTVGPCQ